MNNSNFFRQPLVVVLGTVTVVAAATLFFLYPSSSCRVPQKVKPATAHVGIGADEERAAQLKDPSKVLVPAAVRGKSDAAKLDAAKKGVATSIALSEIFPSLQMPVTDWKVVSPEKMTVCLTPGSPLVFVRVKESSGEKCSTWSGRTDRGALMDFTATKDLFDAVLTMRDGKVLMIHTDATQSEATVYSPAK